MSEFLGYQEQLAKKCENQIGTLAPLDGGQDLIMDPHQKKAMELAAIALTTNKRAFSIIHSCGSGKTILEGNLAVASQRAKEELGMQDTQDVILTTQRALLHSIYEKLDGLGLDVGMWGSGKKQLDRPLILSSIQAIQHSLARGDLSKLLKTDETSLLVGDEADLFLTQPRKRAISQFPNAIKIGLTATDTWPDGRSVEDLWGEKIDQMKLKEGILNGVNVHPLYYLFEANLDDSDIKCSRGDYEKGSLQAALKEAEIQKAVPEVYEALVPKNRRKDFPTLVYVPSVNLVRSTVQELKDKFAGEGMSIGSWTGKNTTPDQLKEDMEAFNKGELDILVLCEMGARGVDLPRARFLIDGYPTLSSTKLEQRSGRVLRRIRENSALQREGFRKAFAMIAQIIPQSNKYRPILLPDILDCWDDFRDGRRILPRVPRGPGPGGPSPDHPDFPFQEEVDRIRRNILSKNPSTFVRQIKEIDVLEQLVLRENLPQTNKDGFFEKDGERYRTIKAWSEEPGMPAEPTIKRLLEGIEGIEGKDRNGNIRKFYSESLVREKCKDLLVERPLANEDGFFEIDGEKHRTKHAWSREPGMPSYNAIKRCLEGAEGIDGEDRNRNIRRFYSESTVRERCEDLLVERPQANDDDFLEIGGEKHRTKHAWSREPGMPSYNAIKRCLEGAEGIEGEDREGNVRRFYSEATVRERCKDLLVERPKANEDGFFEKDGEKHRTKHAWSREPGMPTPPIIKKLLEGAEGIEGEDNRGSVRKFYSESTVRERCKDFLVERPQANEDGFFEKDGEKYGTINAWGGEPGMPSSRTLRKLLEGVEGIDGKGNRGQVLKKAFYSESTVRERCKDLLVERPQANEDGFFEISGERYRTITAWSEEPGMPSFRTLRKLLEGAEGIEGEDRNRNIRRFYSESIVREKLAHLIDQE